MPRHPSGAPSGSAPSASSRQPRQQQQPPPQPRQSQQPRQQPQQQPRKRVRPQSAATIELLDRTVLLDLSAAVSVAERGAVERALAQQGATLATYLKTGLSLLVTNHHDAKQINRFRVEATRTPGRNPGAAVATPTAPMASRNRALRAATAQLQQQQPAQSRSASGSLAAVAAQRNVQVITYAALSAHLRQLGHELAPQQAGGSGGGSGLRAHLLEVEPLLPQSGSGSARPERKLRFRAYDARVGGRAVIDSDIASGEVPVLDLPRGADRAAAGAAGASSSAAAAAAAAGGSKRRRSGAPFVTARELSRGKGAAPAKVAASASAAEASRHTAGGASAAAPAVATTGGGTAGAAAQGQPAGGAAKGKRQRAKGGYCDICKESYTQYTAHVDGEGHRTCSARPGLWQHLDAFLQDERPARA